LKAHDANGEVVAFLAMTLRQGEEGGGGRAGEEGGLRSRLPKTVNGDLAVFCLGEVVKMEGRMRGVRHFGRLMVFSLS